ncbi:hypothetical protein CDAR_592941 [Caerostris darwini]|uniref:BTB domain-containing protein n=1 Tax=Caerostris darwini TaxID=1538125 RepID=A0AAV4TP07_9ARAC|nr:hypothetical protein CDAR_592941 [Caerostris darwini]
MEWRSKIKYNTLASKLNTARKFDRFTDIYIVIGPFEHCVIFKAHRVVLACGSSEFESLFYGSEASEQLVVTFPDVEANGFRYLINFLYDVPINIRDMATAHEVYKVAKKFEVAKLQLICENYIDSTVTDESVFCALQLAIDLNMNTLKDKCLKKIFLALENTLQSKDFHSASQEVVEAILSVCQHRKRNIQHLALMAIGDWWSIHRAYTPYIVRRLLSYVNYQHVTVQYFNSFITKYPRILERREITTMFKHLLEPLIFSLPYWCVKVPEWIPMKKSTSTGSTSSDEYYPSVEAGIQVKKSESKLKELCILTGQDADVSKEGDESVFERADSTMDDISSGRSVSNLTKDNTALTKIDTEEVQEVDIVKGRKSY